MNYKNVRYEKEDITIFNDLDLEEGKLFDKLKPDIYNISFITPPFQQAIPFLTTYKEKEDFIVFKEGVIGDTIKYIDSFFKKETIEKYKDMRIPHKMGLMFFGKQGTGKTVSSIMLMRILCEKYKALGFIKKSSTKLSFVLSVIKNIRRIQDNPVIIFNDEIEISIEYEEAEYLTFLDGSESLDNCLFIGCTNYIEKIPKRISNRRSRFKILKEIKSLPSAVYYQYIIDKLPKVDPNQALIFSDLFSDKGLTLDECKHVLIDHYINNFKIEQAIESVLDYPDVNEDDD